MNVARAGIVIIRPGYVKSGRGSILAYKKKLKKKRRMWIDEFKKKQKRNGVKVCTVFPVIVNTCLQYFIFLSYPREGIM